MTLTHPSSLGNLAAHTVDTQANLKFPEPAVTPPDPQRTQATLAAMLSSCLKRPTVVAATRVGGDAAAARQLASKSAGGDHPSVVRQGGGGRTPPPIWPDGVKVGDVVSFESGGAMVFTSAGWIQFPTMGAHLDAAGYFMKNLGGGARMQTLRPEDMPFWYPLVAIDDPSITPETAGVLWADFLRYGYFFPVLKKASMRIFTPTLERRDVLRQLLNLCYQGFVDKRHAKQIQRLLQAEHGEGAAGVIDFLRESDSFRQEVKSADQICGVHCFSGDTVKISDTVFVIKRGPGHYDVFDHNKLVASVQLAGQKAQRLRKELGGSPLNAAARTIRDRVVVQGGHGLIPFSTADYFSGQGTSGFMEWAGGECTLVDPPADALDRMQRMGLPVQAVTKVIITHVHTDHLTPAFAELLRLLPAVNLTVLSTPTQLSLLQRAYKLGVGGQNEGLEQLGKIIVRPREEHDLGGGRTIRLHYGYHSVPAFALEVRQDGKLAYYFSGDTLADTPGLDRSYPDVTEARRDEILRWQHLLEETWEQEPAPVFMIECGMEGIHTNIEKNLEYLALFAGQKGVSLAEVLARFRFYHAPLSKVQAALAKHFPPEEVAEWQRQGQAPFWPAEYNGAISFAAFSPQTDNQDPARAITGFLKMAPATGFLDDATIASLAARGRLVKVEKGHELIKEGTAPDNRIFMVVSGGLSVSHEGHIVTSVPFGLVGETAVLAADIRGQMDFLNRKNSSQDIGQWPRADRASFLELQRRLGGLRRNATISANQESWIVEWDAAAMATLAPDLLARFERLRVLRDNAFSQLMASPLADLPVSVIDELLHTAQIETHRLGHKLIEAGQQSQDLFLLLDGQLNVQLPGYTAELGRSALVGEMALVDSAPRTSDVVVATDTVRVLRFSGPEVSALMVRYPGLAIALRRLVMRRRGVDPLAA